MQTQTDQQLQSYTCPLYNSRALLSTSLPTTAVNIITTLRPSAAYTLTDTLSSTTASTMAAAPSTSGGPAAYAVGNTIELVERILLHLPVRRILRFAKVNKMFYQIIRGTDITRTLIMEHTKVHKALFFSPLKPMDFYLQGNNNRPSSASGSGSGSDEGNAVEGGEKQEIEDEEVEVEVEGGEGDGYVDDENADAKKKDIIPRILNPFLIVSSTPYKDQDKNGRSVCINPPRTRRSDAWPTWKGPYFNQYEDVECHFEKEIYFYWCGIDRPVNLGKHSFSDMQLTHPPLCSLSYVNQAQSSENGTIVNDNGITFGQLLEASHIGEREHMRLELTDADNGWLQLDEPLDCFTGYEMLWWLGLDGNPLQRKLLGWEEEEEEESGNDVIAAQDATLDSSDDDRTLSALSLPDDLKFLEDLHSDELS
jgi:hypothetical protein